MTRMVEEERLLIGTFKALGYSRARIASKYLVYAFIASAAGQRGGHRRALAGAAGGHHEGVRHHLLRAVPSCAAADGLGPCGARRRPRRGRDARGHGCRRWRVLARATGPAHAAARSEVRQAHPARTRTAGVAAAVVLVEGDVPQLFRYKKRLVMTVIGIAGCTALLLTGWGCPTPSTTSSTTSSAPSRSTTP